MAGAGYKLFNTGDVLTAAQVNTYLQEQTVMVFASSTARTTALSGVLAEGMMSYLQDTNSVEVYNGSSWVALASGDLTEIVAGTGITVTSGTGPIPTVALTTPVAATNGGTAQSTYTTGDLLYASGTNTLAKRAIGTTGQVLTVSGGVPTWAAAAGGGKVLQVVYGTYTTETTIASTSYTDTGLSASITPSSATSKVYVIVVQQARINRNTSNENAAGFRLLRGATQVFENGNSLTGIGGGGTGLTTFFQVANMPLTYLDSPSTTSSTTYKTQGRAYTTANGGELVAQYSSGQSQITLIEIGA